jgi:2-polyprenyl-3-methyl-5-hydroxy-6-metoxy-1,4-benzoquinol methylase
MRKTSHAQEKEPILEYLLRELRFRKVFKYVKKDSIVADLGCGYHGAFLKRISKKIKKGIGYDVAVTASGLPENIILKKGILGKVNTFPKDYFDIVVALAVLEHIDNPEVFLRLAKSMLKKGGVLIITTPHKKGKKALEILSSRLGAVSRGEITDHKIYFDKDGLKKLLKKCGLKVVKLETFEFGLNLFSAAQKV